MNDDMDFTMTLEQRVMINRERILAIAKDSGAVITGTPDGSEPITVVFTPDAWCAFSDQVQAAAKGGE